MLNNDQTIEYKGEFGRNWIENDIRSKKTQWKIQPTKREHTKWFFFFFILYKGKCSYTHTLEKISFYLTASVQLWASKIVSKVHSSTYKERRKKYVHQKQSDAE